MPPAGSESAGFVEIDKFDHVFSLHTTQWAVTVARCDNIVIRAEYKFGRLDDLTAVLPPRSQSVRHITTYTFANREVNFVSDLTRFFSRVDTCCDDRYTNLI
tara:strand:+ start:8020 stop:8325 length:306 start_codon:yes stop_codon:yes gene_type:complete